MSLRMYFKKYRNARLSCPRWRVDYDNRESPPSRMLVRVRDIAYRRRNTFETTYHRGDWLDHPWACQANVTIFTHPYLLPLSGSKSFGLAGWSALVKFTGCGLALIKFRRRTSRVVHEDFFVKNTCVKPCGSPHALTLLLTACYISSCRQPSTTALFTRSINKTSTQISPFICLC